MKIDLKVLTKRAIEEIKPDDDLIVLTIISSLIAGFAIHMNNIPLLIGSMLVGPFFDPIISIVVLGLGKHRSKNVLHAVGSFLLITFIGLSVATIQFAIFNYFSDVTLLTFNPIANIESFLIALLLGGVGMLLWVWPNTSNTSAGVSIAISLIPPLVNIARGIVGGSMDVVVHSLTTYGVNCLGVVLGAYVVLILFGKK